MSRSILLIQGHPDPAGGHFNHALFGAYAEGARRAGHRVEALDVARLDFPLLRSKEEFDHGDVPVDVRAAQAAIERAEHLVLFFPLWLGTLPALLKGFLEQVFRPAFGFEMEDSQAGRWHKRLRGKSARLVVTMGMPAVVYRVWFRAHGVKGIERNVLAFCGFRPIREDLIGMVEETSGKRRAKWLARMRQRGERGE